jgi:hypothetical protein
LFRRRETEPPDLEAASAFDEEGRIRLQYWYCEKQIAYQGFDPCAVVFIANWADEEEQREQQFFAHAEFSGGVALARICTSSTTTLSRTRKRRGTGSARFATSGRG